MKPYGIIYVATNTVNGKKYVGQTIKGLELRKKQHINSSFNERQCGYNYAFHVAIRKHGKESFEWVVVDEAYTKEELDEKEIFYIAKFQSMLTQNGYNSTIGGSVPIQTPETRKKISEKIKGKKKSEEHSKRISETRKKMFANGELKLHENSKKAFEEANEKSKIKIAVYLNGKHVGTYASIRELERETGLSRRSVKRVLDGEREHYKGYTFKKVN